VTGHWKGGTGDWESAMALGIYMYIGTLADYNPTNLSTQPTYLPTFLKGVIFGYLKLFDRAR
jgi:hypothetical protein